MIVLLDLGAELIEFDVFYCSNESSDMARPIGSTTIAHIVAYSRWKVSRCSVQEDSRQAPFEAVSVST